jgi:nitroreductase
MEVSEAIRKRQSIRAYEDKPVPEEKLNRVLEAARLAPSASNRQNWKFVVVKDAQRRRELGMAASGQSFVGEAPVIIAAVATEPKGIMTCEVPRYAVDLAIAVEHIALAAVEEGLGTCWIGAFSQKKVREILGVPEEYKVVTVLPLGFPRREGGTKVRKSLQEIVCYETFTE